MRCHLKEELDISECEREPIRTIGSIQSHGCLIAFGHDRRVSYSSANVADFFGIEPDQILTRELGHFCAPANLALLERCLLRLTNGTVEHFRWDHQSHEYSAWLHLNHGLFTLELEDCDFSHEIPQSDVIRAHEANSIQVLAQTTADAFAATSGYDRVMIYQFHEDWSGQVIAEHRKPEAEPYLGLRYPASDIPSQARQLFTINLLRVIVDAHSTPAPIIADASKPPLDLTYSVLRAASPYHTEYLRNMQVTASLTASLMVDGRLWGMITCHHSTIKPVAPWLRDAAAHIADTMSTRIAALQKRNEERAKVKVVRQLGALVSEIACPEKIVETLCLGLNRLQAVFEIDSAAIYTEGASISIGNAPKAGWIETFAKALLVLDRDVSSFSDSGGALGGIPCAAAAGALAIVLTRNPAIVVLCFRTEFEHELTWGGDMTKPMIRPPKSERLSPRKSFAAYKQTIRGKSLPWTGDDLAKANGMLSILRGLLPADPAVAAAIVSRSIQELAGAVPRSSPLFRSLLDLASEGMSLFIHNQAGSAAPAFATQALLNQFDLDGNGPEFSLGMADFFRNIGLPEDLLNQMHFGPQEVRVVTGRSANRSYLAELKQLLEVETTRSRALLTVLTFRDVTKYARLLETTEAARLQADRASQIKSAFLADMSHEVRTPMNGILGVARILRGMAMPPEQRQLVELVERSGEALLRLVNDILDFSKIEAGKLTLESVPFNLHELLEDAVRLFRPTARPGVELWLALANDVPAMLIGDPVRLRQVVMNLLGNAIKFTHEGRVTLQVKRERAASAYVTLDFCVTDTGIGIAEDKIATLFGRFTQADTSTTREYGGTGLGLAISRQLVTLMGGQIDAASTAGKGTALSFKLSFLIDTTAVEEPVEKARVSIEETSSLQLLATSVRVGETMPQEPASAPLRVLIVDDNMINRKVAAALLTRDGYRVAAAQSGVEAVDLAQRGSYDVILMDCQMPGVDGYEATALIRQGEAGGKRTPIIALTANATKDHRSQCLAAGMDDFITKPINPGEFEEVVRKWAVKGVDAHPTPA